MFTALLAVITSHQVGAYTRRQILIPPLLPRRSNKSRTEEIVDEIKGRLEIGLTEVSLWKNACKDFIVLAFDSILKSLSELSTIPHLLPLLY
jgi:hypothetical protein